MWVEGRCQCLVDKASSARLREHVHAGQCVNLEEERKGEKREYGDGVEREKQLEMMMSGKSRKMKFNVFFSHFFSMFFILVFSFLGKRPLIRRENLKKKGILNREFYKLYTSVAGELRFCKLL